jgi:hypothetical protein
VFALTGMYLAPFGLQTSAALFARSGFPFTGVVGLDADGDGFSANSSFGDRPASLTRNSFRYPATVNLDASLAYDIRIASAQSFQIRFDAFNVTNRKNIASWNNIVGPDASNPPAAFKTVTQVRDQRQAQIAVRYRF